MANGDFAFFLLLLLGTVAGLIFYFLHLLRAGEGRADGCPYTGVPLRPASELSYLLKHQVAVYLRNLRSFDNRPFDIDKAAFSRDTGRLFPNSLTWTGAIRLNWGFLARRYRGHWVSWGSLSAEQQKEIRQAHVTLEGFQTEFSSRQPSPRLVEESFALTKPGPLYVDIDTKVLMGWKSVPDTSLEVLIVQKPFQIIQLQVPDAS